jgi:Skp family chaperone for outer membrane proteins
MKKLMLILALLCSLSWAAPAVVNYDTIYSQWKEAVAVTADIRTKLDEVNVKISAKTDSRNALLKQAEDYATTKPSTEAEAKTLGAKLEVVKKSVDGLTKEINDLQAAPDLRKQISDQQERLRKMIAEAVTAEAKEAKATLVFDVGTLNVYGLPTVVNGGTSDLTAAVLTRLEGTAGRVILIPTPPSQVTPKQ